MGDSDCVIGVSRFPPGGQDRHCIAGYAWIGLDAPLTGEETEQVHTMEQQTPADLPEVGNGLAMGDGGWNFDAAVEKFEEHFRQSIPLCDEGRAFVAELSTFLVQTGSLVYELGVSTGALAREVLRRSPRKVLRYVGIDVVPAMITRARENLKDDSRFAAETADVTTYEFEPADLFLSYYAVQFVPSKLRQQLVNAVYRSLGRGGGFIMYEKVRGPNGRFEDILTQLYTDFKQGRGFLAEEVINKARSLRGILEPFSSAENLDMLERAGFTQVMIVHRFYCFEGYLAIK